MSTPQETQDAIQIIYSNLIVAFRKAHQENDKDKSYRIDIAIRLLEEIWPDECERWVNGFK